MDHASGSCKWEVATIQSHTSGRRGAGFPLAVSIELGGSKTRATGARAKSGSYGHFMLPYPSRGCQPVVVRPEMSCIRCIHVCVMIDFLFRGRNTQSRRCCPVVFFSSEAQAQTNIKKACHFPLALDMTLYSRIQPQSQVWRQHIQKIHDAKTNLESTKELRKKTRKYFRYFGPFIPS